MEHQRIGLLIIIAFIANLAIAGTADVETGYFNDQKGFVDKSSNQEVIDAQNLMGYRYIAIQTHLKGSTVKSVEVFDKNNAAIKNGTPLNISKLSINGEEKSTAILKLWLKMPEGTAFKVKYHFK